MRLALALVIVVGCDTRAPAPKAAVPRPVTAPAASPAETIAETAPVAIASDGGAPIPPLAAEGPLVPLAVASFRDAIVSMPIGATTRRPIVVAAHGNYDRPEWQCSTWRDIVGDCAFVLCPRGVPRTDSPGPDDVRFTYDGGAPLAREIEAGLAALRARFGDYVDDGPMLYAGFSLGAILGVPFVAREATRFPRAVLIEGGHDAWSPGVADAFHRHGGERVLFACGQPSCLGGARAAGARLGHAGIVTRVVVGPGVGHGYTGPVADAVKQELPWLREGDPRCATP